MNEYIGKKVLVRSYDAGVYFGTLEKIENDTCKVSNAQHLGMERRKLPVTDCQRRHQKRQSVASSQQYDP